MTHALFRQPDADAICLDCGSNICQKHRLTRALELAALGVASAFDRVGEEAFIADEKNQTVGIDAIAASLQEEIASCEMRARERNRGEL